MSHKFGFNLLELFAIATGIAILVRPAIFARTKWLRYIAGALLIALAPIHIWGFSLLSTKFQ